MREEIAASQPARKRRLRPRLAVRVSLGLGGLLALLIAAITVALIMVVTVRHDQTSLSDRDVPYANAVATAALNAKGIATDERGFLLTGDQRFIAEADQRVSDARTAFVAAVNAATNAVQRDAVHRAYSGFEGWVQAVYNEFASFKAGHHSAAITDSLGPERTMRKSYEHSLATAQAAGQRTIDSASNSASATSSRSMIILVATLIVAIVLGSAVVYWLFHTIAFPLFRIATLLTTP
jgi:methyl-accepting chemotaxis protein